MNPTKKRILHKLKITEISGVDNPCQEHARMTIMKRVELDPDEYMKRSFTDDQRKQMADKGTAMSDGSYPIANTSDLSNAIQAAGRSANYESTKRHIMRRAKALGAEDQIPDKWLGKRDVIMSSKLSLLKAKMDKLTKDATNISGPIHIAGPPMDAKRKKKIEDRLKALKEGIHGLMPT